MLTIRTRPLSLRFIIAVWIAAITGAQSQQQSPTVRPAKGAQPQEHSGPIQQQPPADHRGTADAPLVVKVLPTTKTQEEAAQDKADREDVSAANWWMVRLTGLIGIIGAVQAIVFWIQAGRLKETINKMDEIAAGQTADMQASVAQATRAAVAMEGVALSMATQVVTTTAMAQNQREFWQRQMRAYVFLNTGSIFNVADPPANFQQVPEEPPPGGRLVFRDRGPIAQLAVRNSGHTPAHNVIHITHMVFREFPLRDPLPDVPRGPEEYRTVFDIPPGGISTKTARLGPPLTEEQIAGLRAGTSAIYVYGEITYTDAFGQAHTTLYRSRHNEHTGAVGISTELTGTNEGNSSN